MSRMTLVIALALCAVVSAARPNVVTAQLIGRNCPESEDQAVSVNPNQPTAFRLRVTNLGDGDVSIFQFPSGGELERSGPLDFVFTPALDFDGTTSFTYRLAPPPDCPRNVILGRVTLESGATTTGSAVGLPVEPRLLCGVGVFAPLAISAGFLSVIHRIRRRR